MEQERLAFAESQLNSYKLENHRLAQELTLLRRAIHAFAKDAPISTTDRFVDAQRLPRISFQNHPLLACIDTCKAATDHVEITGWGFSPAIDPAQAITALILSSASETRVVYPRVVNRPDVKIAFEHASAENIAIPAIVMTNLARSGFTSLVARASLHTREKYTVELQIDGPEFSVRKPTGLSFDV